MPRYKGKIQLHYMCPGDNPAHTVLQLVACCSNSPQAVKLTADAWNTVRQDMRAGSATAAAQPVQQQLVQEV